MTAASMRAGQHYLVLSADWGQPEQGGRGEVCVGHPEERQGGPGLWPRRAAEDRPALHVPGKTLNPTCGPANSITAASHILPDAPLHPAGFLCAPVRMHGCDAAKPQWFCTGAHVLSKKLLAASSSANCVGSAGCMLSKVEMCLCSGSLRRSTCRTTPCSGWSASSTRWCRACSQSRAR